MNPRNFFAEPKRRNVYKVAAACVVSPGAAETCSEKARTLAGECEDRAHSAWSVSGNSGIAPCAISYYQEAMTTITCKITDQISAHLEAVARQRRVPKSQIVREALAASFRKSKPQVSAFDLMKDACGIVKGGPKDYASHARHLKGFGGA